MKSYYVELVDIGKSRLNEEEIDTDNLLDNEAIIKAEYSNPYMAFLFLHSFNDIL